MKAKKLFFLIVIVSLLMTATAVFAADSEVYIEALTCDGPKVRGYSAERGVATYNVWVSGDDVQSGSFRVNNNFTRPFHWSPTAGQVNYLVEVHLPDGTFLWDAAILDCS